MAGTAKKISLGALMAFGALFACQNCAQSEFVAPTIVTKTLKWDGSEAVEVKNENNVGLSCECKVKDGTSETAETIFVPAFGKAYFEPKKFSLEKKTVSAHFISNEKIASAESKAEYEAPTPDDITECSFAKDTASIVGEPITAFLSMKKLDADFGREFCETTAVRWYFGNDKNGTSENVQSLDKYMITENGGSEIYASIKTNVSTPGNEFFRVSTRDLATGKDSEWKTVGTLNNVVPAAPEVSYGKKEWYENKTLRFSNGNPFSCDLVYKLDSEANYSKQTVESGGYFIADFGNPSSYFFGFSAYFIAGGIPSPIYRGTFVSGKPSLDFQAVGSDSRSHLHAGSSKSDDVSLSIKLGKYETNSDKLNYAASNAKAFILWCRKEDAASGTGNETSLNGLTKTWSFAFSGSVPLKQLDVPLTSMVLKMRIYVPSTGRFSEWETLKEYDNISSIECSISPEQAKYDSDTEMTTEKVTFKFDEGNRGGCNFYVKYSIAEKIIGSHSSPSSSGSQIYPSGACEETLIKTTTTVTLQKWGDGEHDFIITYAGYCSERADAIEKGTVTIVLN
jgi:hypothetical protein